MNKIKNKYDETLKSHKNVSFRAKREIGFMLSADIIKISLSSFEMTNK